MMKGLVQLNSLRFDKQMTFSRMIGHLSLNNWLLCSLFGR